VPRQEAQFYAELFAKRGTPNAFALILPTRACFKNPLLEALTSNLQNSVQLGLTQTLLIGALDDNRIIDQHFPSPEIERVIWNSFGRQGREASTQKPTG